MPGKESITGDAARGGGVEPEGQPQEGGSSSRGDLPGGSSAATYGQGPIYVCRRE